MSGSVCCGGIFDFDGQTKKLAELDEQAQDPAPNPGASEAR